MSGLPKVLLVEDHALLRSQVVRELRGTVDVLEASTVEKAWELFKENPDIQVIAIDGFLTRRPGPGDDPETLPLVREIRQTFNGPMLAISSLPVHCLALVRGGCSHKLDNKALLPQRIKRLLVGG